MLFLRYFFGNPAALAGGGDSTPGGVNDVILMENAGGILLEDGTSFIQLDG